jgi:GntR family transcriptional repressor for pyruvate dehydrogenase complex
VPRALAAPPPAVRCPETGALVRRIFALVQDQGLRTGDRLPPIRELADALAVKPGAVRDALLQAQTMGLVRILPRSGAFLRSLSYAPLVDALASTVQPALLQEDHNLFHLLDARRLLEIDLAGRAAERRRLEDLLPVRRALDAMASLPAAGRRGAYVDHDIRFHTEIARLAGNAVLLTLQQALLELLRPHLICLPWTAERRERTDRSHAAIYAALVAGDGGQARSAMTEHLGLAYDTLLRDLQALPGADAAGGSGKERLP